MDFVQHKRSFLMAKVAYSADVNDIRGKIGTNVFSRSRTGATVRIRKSPRNPRTENQTEVRFYLAKAATAYKNLNPTQLTAWKNYAAGITRTNPVGGETYSPAANTVFVGLASKFLQINPSGTIPVTPPAASFAGDTIIVNVTGDDNELIFAASGANAANVKTELLIQSLKSGARTPQPTDYRSYGFVAFTVAIPDKTFALEPGWYAPAYRFVNTLTGQDTEMVVLPVVQVI
jgi:hypothetical protein